MSCRILVLRKHVADYLYRKNNGGYVFDGREAYAWTTRQAFKDRAGIRPLLAIYHANNPIPFSGDTSTDAIDDLFRNVDLVQQASSFGKLPVPYIIAAALGAAFLYFLVGAIL